MPDDLTNFSKSELIDILQDLQALLSQSHVAFLLGAGCSKCAGLPLMSELTEEIISNKNFSSLTQEILSTIKLTYNGAKKATIEDYMSDIVDHFSIAKRHENCGIKNSSIKLNGKDFSIEDINKALQQIKSFIAEKISSSTLDISNHQKFIKTIHGSMQAGKNPREIDYFVLNYDTLIEDALGLEKVNFCDGFSGSVTGWWDPSTFEQNMNCSRVFKLHGSIDWCLLGNDPLPKRIRSGLKPGTDEKHILIYPSSTKYLEAQKDPFAQIIKHFRQSLRPEEKKEKVLIICGYSFGDPHIDIEIEQALFESDGSLTIAAFTSLDKPDGTLLNWLNNPTISQQVRIYTNKGFFNGNSSSLQDNDLPWWKFEVLARLLGGER